MSKVKLTKSQAEVMEIRKDNNCFDASMKLQIEKEWGYMQNKCLNDLTAEEFARAWIEGYEVEPQFKEGDIVVLPESNEFREIKSYENGMVQYTTKKFDFVDNVEIRHATELEKQLFELGRTEPKLKVGDFIIHSEVNRSFVGYSTGVLTANKWLEEGSIDYIYPIETRIEVNNS